MHHTSNFRSATKYFVLIATCIGAVSFILSLMPVQAAEMARAAQQQPNQPDAFEPNDTAATARLLPPSGTAYLTFASTPTLSANDPDWYAIFLQPNQSFVLTATTQAGSLSVQGFDTFGTTVVGSNTGTGAFSTVTIANNQPVQQQYRIYIQNQTQFNAFYRVEYIFGNVMSATPTPIGAAPDAYEPNNLPTQALSNNRSFINGGSTLPNLNFFTIPYTSGIRDQGDVDWYFFYAKKSSYQGGTGGCYRVTTSVQPGTDTEIFVYRGDQAPVDNAFTTVGLLARNDDVAVGRRESQVLFSVPYDGIFWIKVWNLDPTPRGAGQSYTLSLSELPLFARQNQPQANDPCANMTNTYLPVQARNSSNTIQPTPTVIGTSTPPLQPGSQLLAGTVQIITVMANGNTALNEADEYVELRNVGQTPAYLDGWKLKAIRNADNMLLDEYTFPVGAVIAANQTCRIYTNLPFGAENCGFAGGFASDQPIWPPNGARAVLLNPQGQGMARFVY